MSLLILLTAQVAEVAPSVEEEPITVIGKRLENWRGRLTKAHGVYRCRTVRSTGDEAIDAVGCEAMNICITPVQPQIEAIIAAKQPKADRQKQFQAVLDGRLPCLKSKRDELVRKLAGAKDSS